MATQQSPVSNLVSVPHTLQAQLAAQLAAHRTAQLADQVVADAAKLAGEPQSGVLLHRCFSQIEQQPKPDHCVCQRIPYDDALQLIESKKADWFAATRAGKPYRSHKIIVWRATTQQVRDYEIQRIENEPKRLGELEVIRSAEKLTSIERDSIKRLRRLLFDAVQASKLEHRYADLTDTEYRWMLRDPERWQSQLGENVFRMLLAVASRYWEQLLTHFGLHENTGMYMSGGKLMQTGNYKIEQIDAHQNADWGDGPAGEPRALAQPHKPSGTNPQSVLLDDQWDQAVAMANYADRIQKTADDFEKELTKLYKKDQNVVLGYGSDLRMRPA